MNKIRTWLTALFMTVAVAGYADGFEYLVVEQNNGSTQQTSLSSFDQIKFVNGQMVIINGDTTMASYPLISLKKMYFSEGASAIVQVEADTASTLTEIYTTSGVLVRRGDASIGDLPHGIYIIKEGDKVRKVRK